MNTQLECELAKLKPGDHVCPIHESAVDQLAVAVTFIKIGLARGERCFYVASDHSVAEIARAFEAAQVEIARERERGAMRILTKEDVYLRSTEFHLEAMLDFLRQSEAAALRDGFAGFRYLAEMTWALDPRMDEERLVEYEARLNDFLAHSRSIVSCNYTRSRFDPCLIHDILRTHPLVILGDLVSPNPYYEPPQFLLHHDPTARKEFKRKRVDWWIARLTAAMEAEMDRNRAQAELRDSRERLRALTARLESLREEERTRVARQVHDELGQRLTGLKMDLHWLESRLEQISDQRLRTALEDRIVSASSLADETMATVQRIAAELRPAMLDSLGLIAALRHEAEQFESRTGIRVALDLPADALSGERTVSTAAYRIFQEILTNVARHAQATEVRVSLRVIERPVQVLGRHLHLVVEDNGKGLSAEHLSNPKSLGLLGMQERAAMLHGCVRVEGTPGRGTTVCLEIPMGTILDGSKLVHP